MKKVNNSKDMLEELNKGKDVWLDETENKRMFDMGYKQAIADLEECIKDKEIKKLLNKLKEELKK